MIIAIDGLAASGKGTLARRLAAHFGFSHLDTGALYRAVAAQLLRTGEDPHDAAAAARAASTISPAKLDDPRLRADEIGKAASVVAAHPAVRAALLDYQRAFAKRPPGAVLDGRDIGTVVCPDADVKLYRHREPGCQGRTPLSRIDGPRPPVDRNRVRRDLQARDARDESRADAPLKKAEDAHLLDTTKLDIEAAFETAVRIIDSTMRL